MPKPKPTKPKSTFEFPIDFLWGASTAAYQIEGSNFCDWTEWEEKNKLRLAAEADARWSESHKARHPEMLDPDNYICNKACDSFHKFKDDLKCIKDLNLTSYRFSIEWSRIEPQKGKINEEALDYYRDILESLKKNKIKSVVTLWHWTLPLWVRDQGGWANSKTIKDFASYTDRIISEFGDLIDYWVVFNEPTIHVFNGYIYEKFPPQKKSIIQAARAYINLVRSYKASYKQIHRVFPRAQVSNSQILNYFEPCSENCKLDNLVAKTAHFFWNDLFLKLTMKYCDYIGMSYYFHDKITWKKPFIRNKNKTVNDMGWEIYPEGIYHVLMNLKKYKRPIIILENGIADSQDIYRENFIKDHLYYVHKAIQEGVQVKGYTHWSLLDNFEWACGFWPKFGLFAVDRKTKKRTMRKSARVYKNICETNQLTF